MSYPQPKETVLAETARGLDEQAARAALMFRRLRLAAGLLPFAAPSPTTPQLVWRRRDGEVVSALIEEEIQIGRAGDCDVILAAPGVSRRHARIKRVGDRCCLEDLGSSNGVKVNGVFLAARELRSGDLIEVGGMVLLYVGC